MIHKLKPIFLTMTKQLKQNPRQQSLKMQPLQQICVPFRIRRLLLFRPLIEVLKNKHFIGYRQRRRVKKFLTITIEVEKVEIASIKLGSWDGITLSPLQDPVKIKSTQQKQCQLRASFSIDKIISRRISHTPDQSVAIQESQIPEFPINVNQTLLKFGDFNYQDYIDQPRSEFYNYSYEDSQLPYLEPYQILKNGNIYIGQWNLGKQHGRGKYIYTNGNLFEGFWESGYKCGIGRMIHTNGDTFLGDWNLGQISGQGVYTHSNGSIQQGEWKNSKQHGEGQEIWMDGSAYRGEYVYGLKSGQGKYTWPDQSIYQGNFKNNMFDGHGIYDWIDGRQYKGDWQENKMHGKGTFIWADGRKYTGDVLLALIFQYVNDIKQGNGKFTFLDGSFYKGQWENGKMHGHGQLTDSNWVVNSGNWFHGKYNG